MSNPGAALSAPDGPQVYAAPKVGRVYTVAEAPEAAMDLALSVLDREHGAVVLDADGVAWQVRRPFDSLPMLCRSGRSMFVGRLALPACVGMFPLTVLWVPDTPQGATMPGDGDD